MSYIEFKTYCRYPFHRMKVAYDGLVSMCSSQERNSLGNILEQSFEEIWLGKTARDVREEVLRNRIHPNCLTKSCPYVLSLRKPDDLEFKKFPIELELDLPKIDSGNLETICDKLSPYIKHFKYIIISNGIEPFKDGKIYDVLRWLKYTNDINLATLTNGNISVLNFLKYTNTSLTFSLLSTHPEIYKSLTGYNLDNTLNNIKEYAFQRAKEQKLRIYNAVNLFNLKEVEQMVELAHSLKVDELEFNSSFGMRDLGVNSNNAYLFKQGQSLILHRAKELGVNVTFAKNLYLDYDVNKRVKVEVKETDYPNELVKGVNARYNRKWLI